MPAAAAKSSLPSFAEVGISRPRSSNRWNGRNGWSKCSEGKDYDLTIVSHTEPMDINIYARPDYYFQYDNPDFQALMADLDIATDAGERSDLLKAAQQTIADDYVNGYLFQLARTGVANAKIEGLWVNAPTQANDLTGVRWVE